MRTLPATLLFSLVAQAQTAEIRLEPLISGLQNPTDIQSGRDGSGRLFIVQRSTRRPHSPLAQLSVPLIMPGTNWVAPTGFSTRRVGLAAGGR